MVLSKQNEQLSDLSNAVLMQSISGESQAQPEPTDIAIRTQNNERNGQAQGYGVQQFEPAVK